MAAVADPKLMNLLAELEKTVPAEQMRVVKMRAATLLAERVLLLNINATAELALASKPKSGLEIAQRLEIWTRISHDYRLVEQNVPRMVEILGAKDKTVCKVLDLFRRFSTLLVVARNMMPTWAVDLNAQVC